MKITTIYILHNQGLYATISQNIQKVIIMFAKFEIKDIENFSNNLQELIDTHQDKIKELINNPSDKYEDILMPLQDMDEELSLFFTPLSHINSVMNSKESQKAYEEALPILSEFHSKISQNRELFEKISSIKYSDEESAKVVSNDIKEFKLSGIDLPKEKQKELEEISLELSKLSNEFSQNLLNATNEYELIITDAKDVEGMPKNDIESAKEIRDGKVVYRFTLQIPSYLAYMTYGINREYRKELAKAYSTRAPQNAKVIDKILLLKDKKAKILGFENYAELSLQRKDAPSQERVIEFLNTLLDSARDYAKDELDELKSFAKELDGIEDIESYDVAYYSEKLKKVKFDFDDSITKVYFEQEKVLNGMLDVVSELFDIEFKLTDIDSWHQCVKIYDIYENGSLSGRIYFDLEAREEKRGGAWMNDYETRFIDSNSQTHLPSAFVVCNFSPATNSTPSLLRHDDVVTLFHEMGHALHHLLSRCNQRSISGINGVAWDVVEFPSQFLENFAYEGAILKKFAYHYESKEPISDELLLKIKESKNFQAALGILRQVEFSLFDFMLHQKLYQGDEVQNLLDSIQEKTALIKPPAYNRFQHGFAHIFAGGYSAGYYSYKWAEVLSADAFFECLDTQVGFDKEKAKGYKKYILSNGGKEDMNVLYKKWLHRDADVKSLLKLYELI
jgi:oligopeptidase A